jgi:hypothetical protein
MAHAIPPPTRARKEFKAPVVQGLPFVAVVINAPTKKEAREQRTAAATNAVWGLSVQAKGTTEGRAPMMKKLVRC